MLNNGNEEHLVHLMYVAHQKSGTLPSITSVTGSAMLKSTLLVSRAPHSQHFPKPKLDLATGAHNPVSDHLIVKEIEHTTQLRIGEDC